MNSAHGSSALGAPRVGGEHVPGVVVRRSLQPLPWHVASVVPDLNLCLHLQVGVVLLQGPGVRALLRPAHVDAVRVGRIYHLVPLVPVQQESLQRHRVLPGQEEGGLRDVLARHEHLAGALQVEENAGPAGVVHVPVVLQKTVVEQAVVPDAGGLKTQKKNNFSDQNMDQNAMLICDQPNVAVFWCAREA